MKRLFYVSKLLFLSAVFLGLTFESYAQTSFFFYTGSMQSWTVPAGVTSIIVSANGAAGGLNSDNVTYPNRPGYGAQAQGVLAVTPGDVLNIYVGGQGGDATIIAGGIGGFNGGGNGVYAYSTYAGGAGGGASDIRINGTNLTDRVIVAAGGGGAGLDCLAPDTQRGGDGGTLTGEDGGASCSMAGSNGLGGTPGAGGAGGTFSGWGSGTAGTFGDGGTGTFSGGGGGGGGWYGGGGGSWGGGGGGSSYTDALLVSNVTHARGVNTSNGLVTLTLNPPSFVNGASQNYATCQDAAATNISSLFNINDLDAGQTETFTVVYGPSNGTLSGFPTSTTSNGSTVGITGITYQPTASYSGPDSFSVSVYDNNGSYDTTVVYVTVNPTPDVNAIPNATYCNGATTAPVYFSGSIVGTTFTWTNSNISIGLAASGADSIGSFTATNGTFVPAVSTVVVTPSANGCAGPSTSFNFTVNPTPDVLPVTGQTLCNGAATSAVVFGSNVAGTTYTWTNDSTNIGLAASGSGNIGSFTATNAYELPVVSVVTVTPTANSCVGNSTSFTFTVNPTPMLSSSLTGVVCDSDLFSYTLTSNTPGTTFTWNRDVVAGISNAAANGTNIINEYLQNTTPDPIVVTYVDSLWANGCVNTQNVLVTVNPTPTLNSGLNVPAICDNTTFTYNPTSLTAGTTFSWTRDTVTGISNGAGLGTGGVSEVLDNTTPNPIVVTYVYTLLANGCLNSEEVKVVVNPTPSLSSSLTPPAVCDSTQFSYVLTSATLGTTFTWSRAMVFGISNPAGSGIDTVNDTLNNTTTGPITVTYVANLSANGCSNTEYITVAVNPTPTLSTTTTPADICSGTPFVYVPASATTGTTFSWSRGVITGISNPAASGADTINETLINTTPNPVAVTYIDTLNINGCINTETITVIVKPTPKLSSSLTPAAICDSATFNYPPTSATVGTTFDWTRDFVSGIAVVAGSGTNNPNEQLINTTYHNVNVTYTYTLTADGCTNTQDVVVTVRPTPVLSSVLTHTVCSGVPFNYTATSITPATTFSWTRAFVSGISPVNGTGSTANINETLVDSLTTSKTVTYVYTLNISGCTHKQNVTVTVNPAPAMPTIATMSPASLCSSTEFQNFGAATTPPSGVTYAWTATNATVWATGNTRQYALISFPNAGTSVVKLTAIQGGTSCPMSTTYTVSVGSGVSDHPSVIYYYGQFICLQNDMDSYQWGYDDAMTLDSTIIPGEINPNYFISAPATTNRNYWVITKRGDCMQKTYYNAPTGIVNVNAGEVLNVYPNPASDYINVDVASSVTGDIQVEVLNMLGQKLQVVPALGNKATINVANLAAGSYLVNCYRDGIKLGAAKFIKN